MFRTGMSTWVLLPGDSLEVCTPIAGMLESYGVHCPAVVGTSRSENRITITRSSNSSLPSFGFPRFHIEVHRVEFSRATMFCMNRWLKKLSLCLEYVCRISLSLLVLYVVIHCPLDCDLSSRACKSLFLYRKKIVYPTFRASRRVVLLAGRTGVFNLRRSFFWFYENLGYSYAFVSAPFRHRIHVRSLTIPRLSMYFARCSKLPLHWT